MPSPSHPPMPAPAQLTLETGYAAYRPVGDAPAAPTNAALLATLAWCRDAGVTRLLADVRGLTAIAGMNTMTRFELGRRAAEEGRGQVRVAVVLTDAQRDPEHFAESVARNRGLDVALFADEVAALAWLVGPNAVRPVLETERLRLRWLVPDDAPFILPLTTQPSWLRNIGDRGVRDLATAEGYIRNGPLASYAARGYGLWCAERKEDGVPVGICGIIKRDSMDDPELAYAYLERFHGMGYGSEAAIATLEYARSRLGLPRLAAIVNPENRASIRILEKAGMTYRGPILMPGETVPISHYTT